MMVMAMEVGDGCKGEHKGSALWEWLSEGIGMVVVGGSEVEDNRP